MFISQVNKNVITQAVRTFGWKHQTVKAVEELAELQVELCKHLNLDADNLDKIAEEMGDVYIMLEQLQIIFGNNEQVADAIDLKIKRLRGSIDTRNEAEARHQRLLNEVGVGEFPTR